MVAKPFNKSAFNFMIANEIAREIAASEDMPRKLLPIKIVLEFERSKKTRT
ncbi:MAG TPA: hypothetical protein VI358_12240 [Pseudolabrys sp.]